MAGDTQKTASVISIGNELLSGRTADTNAAFIAGRLRRIGIPVVSLYGVADEMGAIAGTLARAVAEADVVITTGGLGPTDDDLARQGIAQFLGVELTLREHLLEGLRQFFTRRGVEMVEKNVVQACVPQGARAIENPMGTAPGLRVERGDRLLFAMPGVPREMKHMFERSVLPELRRFGCGHAIVVRRLRCFGAGESTIAQRIGQAMRRGRNPEVNCTAHAGIISLEIVATAPGQDQAETMAGEEERSLRAVLGDLVYGTGDQTLAEVVGRQLTSRGQTVAVAESCTGGLLAKLITDVPGSSRYFTHGWVTYSNQAKRRELEVPAEMIDTYGAVSEQVALAMAQGARRRGGSDFAVGITGIAGPGGGNELKPVGLVYIAVGTPEDTGVSRHVFSFDRDSVRRRAAQTALNLLRLQLCR